MYPIERDDYVKAYMAAISEEMKESRRAQQKAPGSSDAFNRFHQTIARVLHRNTSGPPPTLNPVPHG
ncbi:MAG: hypothetical protein M3092_04315 [Actinomycetia bacterium]|nr:hypothetical protein [Actinomycetes bacterium]